jgi:hypothetical protein
MSAFTVSWSSGRCGDCWCWSPLVLGSPQRHASAAHRARDAGISSLASRARHEATREAAIEWNSQHHRGSRRPANAGVQHKIAAGAIPI